MAHPNKSKMAAAAIFNFGKISIIPDWIRFFGKNFPQGTNPPEQFIQN